MLDYSLSEFHFLGLGHFSGKQKVWTLFRPSAQEVSD